MLGQTLALVHRLGLSAALLPTLRDVDTIADARAVGLVQDGQAPQVAVGWQLTARASGS